MQLIKYSDEFLSEWERWHGNRTPGLLAHACDEWDGMLIDVDDFEFFACSCQWKEPQAQFLSASAQKFHSDKFAFEQWLKEYSKK